MAGHSHWAGIKHKKGKADKQKSKIFSKLSREITVAAKLGDKDPDMNSRLRSAIQAARAENMPRDNIERAIDKSSVNAEANFESLRYEGFGPNKIAVIIESLTDKQFQKISQFFDTMPTLRHEIELNCKNKIKLPKGKGKEKECGYKEEVKLEGLASFFG